MYLIGHAGYGATKIGIAGETSTRLRRHQRYGWEVVTTETALGKAVLAAETDVLRWWRGELGLPIHLGPDDMPQGGWTETVATCAVDLTATINRMRRHFTEREEVA